MNYLKRRNFFPPKLKFFENRQNKFPPNLIILLNRQLFSKKTKKSKFLPEFQYIYFASINGYYIASRSLFSLHVFSLHWRKKTSNVFHPRLRFFSLLVWFFFSRRVVLVLWIAFKKRT